MSFLYFCYASNMLTKRMHINCPSAKRKCIAKLPNYKLAFEGYTEGWEGASATIVECSEEVVWGVVWEIDQDQEEKLDRQEEHYKSMNVTVRLQDDSELVCKTFKKLPTSDGCIEPSLVYKTVILEGAKEHNLPSEYIEQIKNMKDNGYKGKVDVISFDVFSNA